MNDDDAFGKIAGKLKDARCTVVFTGAGISTESGIADFRSPGGVWSRYRPVIIGVNVPSSPCSTR